MDSYGEGDLKPEPLCETKQHFDPPSRHSSLPQLHKWSIAYSQYRLFGEPPS